MQALKQKSFTTTSLLSIFILCFLLVIIRWINIFNEDVYVISVVINSHITNFTLSLMMCTLIGYLLLSTGKEYVSTIMVGILLIVVNFIYEIFLPILNTTDTIVFGDTLHSEHYGTEIIISKVIRDKQPSVDRILDQMSDIGTVHRNIG